MKPIEFKGCNTIYGKDQDEYNNLPALAFEDGEVVTCYKLSFLERLRVLFTGKIWCAQKTFGNNLQPVYKSTKRKELFTYTKNLNVPLLHKILLKTFRK